jgi:adenine-specific DNA-methyltransferase
MDARGEIYWSPTGNPRRKIYLDQSEGVPVQDIWMDFRDAHNQNIEVSGYPTEKNPDLLKRLIEASSNPTDLVLDCFSGCGTSLNMASHLGRCWIGVDNSPEAIGATLRRFGKGLEPMGDFVSRLESAETEEESGETLPLFRPEEIAKPAPKQTVCHRVIKDFALLAQEPYEGDLNPILQQWRDWVGESKALHLGERPPPYKVGKVRRGTAGHRT